VAQPRFCHDPVRGFVHRLHRGDHPVAAKARDIGRIDDLGMLHAPAAIALVGGREIVDRGEHGGIGSVADGVDGHLKLSIAARLIRLPSWVSFMRGRPRVAGASA
jgi:hypothetical protein